MKFEYLLDNTPQVVEENNIEEFITKNPQAKFIKEIDEPGKTTPSLEDITGAPAEEKSMASKLAIGSSELSLKDKQPSIGYIGEKAIIGEGVVNPLQEVELTGQASNFYTNLNNLINSDATSEQKNTIFQKSTIPSDYIAGTLNIRAQEDPDFKNIFEDLKNDVANFSTLDSKKQDNVIQQLFETAFTPQRNNPLASAYDQEINNIIKQTQEIVAKNNSSVFNEVNNQWLQTEQGRREQQLETQYGKDLKNLEVNTLSDSVVARDYYANQIDKQRFFEKTLQNKNIEVSKESKEIFGKLYDENELIQTYTKKASQSIYNFIDKYGTKLRRQAAGLSENPGEFERIRESVLKGIKQMKSGFIGKQISKYDKIYDHYKKQSESWENLNDNDLVKYGQFDSQGNFNFSPVKITVKEAKKRQFDHMLSKNKELFKLLETDTKLATALNTLGNNDRFIKEINSLEDFLDSPFLATLEMAPQIVTGAITFGTSIVAQEAGSNYNDQLTNIVTDPENQEKIKAYLEKEGLEDTLDNKKLAAHFVLPEKLDKLTADGVGIVNGILEGLPFLRFVPGANKILSKILGPRLSSVFATTKQNIMSAKNFGLYTVTEGITEGLQGQASAIGQGVAEGGWKNKFKFLSFDNFMQEMAAGSKATLIPMGFGAMGTISNYVKATDGKTQKDKDAILEKERNRLKEDFEANFITLEEYNDGIAKLDSFQKIEEALAPSIKGEARIKMAGLINIKNKLKAEKQKRDEAFSSEYDEQIAGINSEIQSIVESEKASRVDEVSIIKEPSVTISGKNRQIAQKNKDLMAIIKDERTEEPARRKAEADLYINNQGLINDVVNQKFDPSKDTGLQKESLIAEANLAFVELMRTFTPAKGEFGAYARRYINLRLNKSIAELTGSQKNPETGKFEIAPKQDITETQVEDTIVDDSSQVLEKVGIKLKSSFGLDDGTVNKIKNAVKKVFGTSLPAVTDKNFKKKTIEAFKDELTDLVKRDGIFGKDSQEFAAFLEDNAEAIYNSLPLDVMTKSFLQFTEKQINTKTGKPIREATKAGKEVFKKKDFADVKDEFINYFIDPSLGSSTRSDRKTSIAKQIADQLARDEVVDVLSDPEVSQKFKDVQELEGKTVPEDFLDRIVRELDRGLEWLNKQQQNNTLQFSLGVKEIAIAAGKLAINSIKVSLKAGNGIAKGLKVAVKAVQDAYGNREINPYIEKAIRNNVSRQKESIKINDSGMQQAFEIIMMEAQKDISTKLNIDDIQTILKNPKEIKKSIKFLEDSMQDIIKDLGPQAVDLLYKFGKNTFAHSPQGRLFVGKAGWDAWFKKSFPKFKPAKKEFNSDRPSSKKITPQLKKGTYNFEADKIRANQAMQLYKSMFKAFVDRAKKNNGLNNQLGIMMTLLATPTQSVLRLAAPIKYSINIKTLNEPLHLEHLTPSAFINSLMFEYYYNGNTKFDIEKVLKDYSVAIIPDGIKKILDEKGSSQRNQHPSYELGKKSPTVRIFNEDVKQLVQNTKYSNLILLDTETGKPVNGFELNDKIIKEEQSKLSTEFNQILEETKGIDKDEIFSEAQGRNMGRRANKFKVFVPYSAEDLLGLLYRFAGKGKQGDQHLKWIKDNITTPLTESYIRFETNQQTSANFLKEAKKLIKDFGIDLNKEVYKGYTNDQIIRIHLWSTTGYDLEKLIGMKPDQVQEINKFVRQNYGQLQFLDDLKKVYFNNENKYPEPDKEWITGTLTTDLLNFTNTVTRAEAFKPFYDNIEAIFGSFDKQRGKLSGDNLNKVKALYGTDFVKALESSLYRIGTGKNKSYQLDQQGNTILNWMNNSIGTIMFFNTRSALLQTISNINFTNWTDNNPFMLAKAWANQPQFWKDFSFLYTSDYLQARRGGLKTDINEQEIADAAAKSDKKVAAVIATILKKGFLPTQIADSFAIALGGASFYRNRINSYKKNGLSQQEAESEAFKDFREISEETQQSSRPDKISMEQAGFAGRLILAFQNTPMQYNRLAKKAGLDLINGRGDIKTNISKIIYYLGVQNAVFYSLQQALFSIYFDDEEDEKKKVKTDEERYFDVANGMIDSILRGSGVYGALISTLKNATLETIDQTKEKNPQYINTIKELSGISPPLNSKFRKLLSIDRRFRYKQELEKMRTMGLETKNPAILSAADALSVGFNLPADRVLRKINNLRTALEEETQLWQSIALSMGYSTYDVGIDEFKNSSTAPKTKGLKKKTIKKKTIKKK